MRVSRTMHYLTLVGSSMDTSMLEQYQEGVSLPVCVIRSRITVNVDHPESGVVLAGHFLLFPHASMSHAG